MSEQIKKVYAANKRCGNCLHWKVKDYIHCKHSGEWGGNIQGDKNCTWEAKIRK